MQALSARFTTWMTYSFRLGLVSVILVSSWGNERSVDHVISNNEHHGSGGSFRMHALLGGSGYL